MSASDAFTRADPLWRAAQQKRAKHVGLQVSPVTFGQIVRAARDLVVVGAGLGTLVVLVIVFFGEKL